jgi:hypothetical protein
MTISREDPMDTEKTDLNTASTEDLAAIRKMMEAQKTEKEKKDKLAAVNTIANFAFWLGAIIVGIVLLVTFLGR